MAKITPIKSIRKKCLDCSGTSKEVKLCTVTRCPLYPYRMGRRPKDDNLYIEDVGSLKTAPTMPENNTESIMQQ